LSYRGKGCSRLVGAQAIKRRGRVRRGCAFWQSENRGQDFSGCFRDGQTGSHHCKNCARRIVRTIRFHFGAASVRLTIASNPSVVNGLGTNPSILKL